MAIFGDTFGLLFILTSDHTACQVPTSNEQQRKFSSEKKSERRIDSNPDKTVNTSSRSFSSVSGAKSSETK